MPTAAFYIYGSLNDVLLPVQREQCIAYAFDESAAIKDPIEALGIPHTEVKYILVNNTPVDFTYRLQAGDEVKVYGIDVNLAQAQSLQPVLPAQLRFAADVHLGKLARRLRLLGLDCLYDNRLTERNLLDASIHQQRILLTRSTGLLKHKALQWGHWLRSTDSDKQAKEVIQRYELANSLAPFKRCTVCNGLLQPVSKAAVEDHLLPRTKLDFNDFWQCEHCRHIYWQGSHYERMLEFIKGLRVD